MKYVKITRRTKKYHTFLTRDFQTATRFTFLVREKIAKKFPRKISRAAIHMSDYVFADGYLIKNLYGPACASKGGL